MDLPDMQKRINGIVGLEDNFLHKGLREELVNYLASQGISERVQNAFREVPRHFFVEHSSERNAYKDMALPILFGQTISRPLTVARQTDLLEISAGEKILEIGTGSGFQTMILAALKAKVYSIERHRNLHLQAKQHKLNSKFLGSIFYFYGDGYQGLPAFQPFDKILVTAGATEIPSKLFAQLKPEGIMVIPIGEGENQVMLRIKREVNGEMSVKECGNFSFVPMLEGLPRLENEHYR